MCVQITLRCLIYWDLLIRINKNSCAFQKRKQVYRTRTLIVFIKLCSSIIHWSISITDLDCSWSLFLDIRLMEMTRICGVWSWELSTARGLDLDPHPPHLEARKWMMDVIILHKRTWYTLDLHWVNWDESFWGQKLFLVYK